LKRLLHSLVETSVAVLVGLAAANNAIGGSSNQALDLTPNTAEENGARTTANVDGKGVFLKGYDTVAYFKQGKALKGNPAIESTYQGVTYLFASAENKADFDKDPAKYVAQYGGFCAYAVANGVIAAPDAAEVFFVYKGKLYIAGNPDALKSFKTHIDENIEKADAYWHEVTGS
jgi:YHS domain-containing protein